MSGFRQAQCLQLNLRFGEHRADLLSPTKQFAMCSPSSNDQICGLSCIENCPIIFLTHWISRGAQTLGIGGPKREDVRRHKTTESPAAGEPHATTVRWVERERISSRWVQHQEVHEWQSGIPHTCQ